MSPKKINLDANIIFEKQEKAKEKQIKDIVDFHYKKIIALVEAGIHKKKLLYHVEDFVPGFYIQDAELVTKKVVFKLVHKDRFEIKIIDKKTFIVLWDISNKEEFKKHLNTIIHSIKNKIEEEKHLSFINYTFQYNKDFPIDSIKKNIVEFLKNRNFHVEDSPFNYRVITIFWNKKKIKIKA